METTKYVQYISGLLFFIVFTGVSPAQNSRETEKETYRLYTEKKWDSLIVAGKQALDAGIDYYYLRMRVGIAQYEKKQYRLAQIHFRKATEFNSSDELALEYLYYSHLFSGQLEEAQKTTKKFSKDLKKRLELKKHPLEVLFAEGGIKRNSASSSPLSYLQCGLRHQFTKNASLTHAYSIFRMNISGFVPGLFVQNQYYLKATIPLGQNWLFSPSVHWISKKFTPEQITVVYKETILPSRLFSATVRKTFPLADVGVSASYLIEENLSPVLQQQVFLRYFPFANNKLHITVNGYSTEDKNTGSGYFSKSLSVAIFPLSKMQLSLSYLSNKSIYLNEENGYIVNNSPDLTTSRISLLSEFFMNRHFAIYVFLARENKAQQTTNSTYTYNSIFGGLKLIP